MLIFGIQVAFDNTQLVRVISSRSRSNIKVTFLRKMAVSGTLVFHKHILLILSTKANQMKSVLPFNPLPHMSVLGSSNSAANKDMMAKIWTNGEYNFLIE